eukprot:TRINITY_DN61576_c0_g1_i1.p1 TRINITY_DN61576_c0_g1~~TRINITY_DN61576_c0_g1_i1.p1  ORF type:complete len:379 (+),score=76.92 TRINITY_DN61576_c0_g1_i1:84-1139(+)
MRYQGEICLAISILIFSASSATFQALLKSPSFPPGVITPCSVLLGGNIVGAVSFSLIFRQDVCTCKTYLDVDRHTWAWILVSSLLYSVVGPFLFLTALTQTPVVDVLVVQRLESVNIVLLSWCLFGMELRNWDVLNAGLTVVGVLLGVLFTDRTQATLSGAGLVIVAGWAYSSSLAITQRRLGSVSIGLLATFRVLFGAVSYHFLSASIQGGMDVFRELYSRRLWKAMLWYGPIFVTGGQWAWLIAVRKASPSAVAVGMTFLFPLSIVWAAVLVGNMPDRGQLMAAGVLTVAAVSGCLREQQKIAEREAAVSSAKFATPGMDHSLLAGPSPEADLHHSSRSFSGVSSFKGI